MPIDLDAVGRRRASRTVSWSSSQALLYALGVGAGVLMARIAPGDPNLAALMESLRRQIEKPDAR